MGLIHQLPEEVSIKIAAGEVVERPASVVKELVENALDAGATQVTVLIHEGGKSCIEVRDNGSGMDREDAVNAFLRHGTSKITSVDDLDHVTTLGFRGEALAAISASAEVELITTRANESEGTHVLVSFGANPKVKPHAPLTGTTIRVSNLFAELPVRQKFLKSDATEWKSCLDVLMKQMLVHPEVAFHIIHNDRDVYALPANQSMRHRAAQLWDVAPEMLIEVKNEIPHFSLSGVIAKPEVAHGLRSRQFLSVNGHPIQDKMFARSIKDAFGTLLPPGLYPTYALHLAVHPGIVDVNIHPRKDEVRFVNSQEVYRFVFQAVSQALQGIDHAFASFQVSSSFTAPRDLSYGDSEVRDQETSRFQSVQSYGALDNLGQRAFSSAGPVAHHGSLEIFHQTLQAVTNHPSPSCVLVVDNCFLAAEHEGKLLLVDQHAAHERILYDKLWANESQQSQSHQKLLFPSVLALAPDEAAHITTYESELRSLGFDFNISGQEVTLLEVPTLLKGDSQQIFRAIVRGLGEERVEPELTTVKHRIFATVACKAAVKAGDVLTDSEKRQLLTDLLEAGDKFTCPHGRPSHITISAAELEKLFMRTGF